MEINVIKYILRLKWNKCIYKNKKLGIQNLKFKILN